MLRKPLALLVALGFVFALAACGDDSGSATATTSGSSGSEAPAASSGAPDTGSGSAGTTAAPNFSGSGSDKFCAQAKGFDETLGATDFGQSSDPAQVKESFTKAQDALKQLEASAPDEIKADVTTVSEAFTSLIAVFESANYDFTKLAQDPEALAKLESFGGQEVQDASTRIEAYFSQVCGISTTDTTP
jgi:hypothetical protein